MRCPTVVLTSPGKGGIRDLRKFPGRKRFWMYTWNRDELEMCREQLPQYSTLPVDLLQKLYQVCGGVARSVFQPALSDYDLSHAERDVNDAIAKLKASDVADVVANVCDAGAE
ncbi:hypothetical protein WJX72_009640 [[Myrmecia] bisecta]|uniref:Uncharacterized protein n=1 Tax=[Myrmecia] bisecta TaxID=41462 RepID=A0AAW1PZ49_9CHLO